MKGLYSIIAFAPLFGAVVCGLFGRRIGRGAAHRVAIGMVALSFLLSLLVLAGHLGGQVESYHGKLYTWLASGDLQFSIGFLVDRLTVLMMVVVTGVSLAVHVYTVGYMADDPGYQRFFAYINLFTFAMLMLVMADNFLQLFFGWEAVGLVSYLLIGFWFKRDSAVKANLKAFLVNRVGDFGFLLGIAAVLHWTGSLDYDAVFAAAPSLIGLSWSPLAGAEWAVPTLICLLLFVGAMGKSAQVPLHVWLPDSMEGPTPISALIHAATMVTAGIFMVARMSPLFELSDTALSVVLVIGATTALFMGLVGLVQQDIKRVVAYSTLSQLGYMTAALGASAYSAAIFHLMTHAFFKALLFLAAGSVIIALHHQQDMRRMGGLRHSMPVTFWTSLIGTLALIGAPGFSGFYSKDAILEAVHAAERLGSSYAYWALLIGVFVTALYSFRLLFLVFFGDSRADEQTRAHLHESPRVVTWPLIALAVPSVAIGALTLGPVVFGGWLGAAIHVDPANDVLSRLGYEGVAAFTAHAFATPPLYLAAAGALLAWWLFLRQPALADALKVGLAPLHRVLDAKYGFDLFNERVLAAASRGLGRGLWRGGDAALIDGLLVDGSAAGVGRFAQLARRLQSGLLYHYAFAMIIGLLMLIGWFVLE